MFVSFDTDVEKLLPRVSRAFQGLTQEAERLNGVGGGEILRGIGPELINRLRQAYTELQRLDRAAEQLATSKKGPGAGSISFARGSAAELQAARADLDRMLVERARGFAAGGGNLEGVNLNALRKQAWTSIFGPVEQAARTRVQSAGAENTRYAAAFGRPSDIPALGKGLPDLNKRLEQALAENLTAVEESTQATRGATRTEQRRQRAANEAAAAEQESARNRRLTSSTAASRPQDDLARQLELQRLAGGLRQAAGMPPGGGQPPKPPAAPATPPEPPRKPQIVATAAEKQATDTRLTGRRLYEEYMPLVQDLRQLAREGIRPTTGVRQISRQEIAVGEPGPKATYYRMTASDMLERVTDAKRRDSLAAMDRELGQRAERAVVEREAIQAERDNNSLLRSLAPTYAARRQAKYAFDEQAAVMPITGGGFRDVRSAFGERWWETAGRGRLQEVTDPNAIREMRGRWEEDEAYRRHARALDENTQRDSQATTERIEREHAVAAELRRLESTLAREAKGAGIAQGPSTGVYALGSKGWADVRSGTPMFYERTPQGGAREAVGVKAGELASTYRGQQFDAEVAAETRRLAEERKQAAATTRESAAAEKQLARSTAEFQRRGVLNNFLLGINNPSFGSSGGGYNNSFEGLARSAGQAVKYSTLYQGLFALQQVAGQAMSQFLDFNDSITELDVAMRGASDISSGFLNNLQDFAALGGFNVGEAMDVAASGIRAFRDEAAASGVDVTTMGEDFAQQASRIAVLSKTTLQDAAGNLKAIAAGFELPKSQTGFTQITDAIAGAKLIGGGDEKQIGQGLANAALIMKEMGFSLNESATIISKINAETDQSGQLIANRISRLSTIIGGTHGQGMMMQINAALRPDQRVDTTGSTRDQVVALSKVWGDLSDAQRKSIETQLGGTANARELVILMREMASISKDVAGSAFVGAGAREFQKRLENARSLLTQIQGDIKAIIVNLARAGLADPFILLLDVLKPISSFLREVTQALASIGEVLGPWRTLTTTLLAAGAALKVLSGIQQAGGFGAFVLAQEARFAPARGLARKQLAQEAEDQAKVAAQFATTGNPAVNARLSAASAAQVAAADRLRAVQTGLDKTPATDVEGRRIAQERVRQAEAELALRKADLAHASEAQRAESTFAGRWDRERAKLETTTGKAQAANLTELGRVDARMQLAQQAGDTAKLHDLEQQRAVLQARENEIRDAHVKGLAAIDARERAARTAMLESQARGRVGRFTDEMTLGGYGRANTAYSAYRARMTEAIAAGGQLGGLRQIGREAGGAVRAAGSGLVGLLGGPAMATVMGGLIAIEVGSAIKSAYDKLNAGQEEAMRTALQPLGTSAQALHEAATANATAAKNMEEARSGFWAGLLDNLGGGKGEQQQVFSQDLARFEERTAHAMDVAQQRAARSATGADQLASAIDLSSAQGVTDSFKALTDEGRPAADRVTALTAAIGNLAFAADATSTQLTESQRIRMSGAIGKDVATSMQAQYKKAEEDLNKAEGQYQGTKRSPAKRQAAADAIKAAQSEVDTYKPLTDTAWATTISTATKKFISTNRLDLTSSQALDSYRAALTAQLNALHLPPAQVKALTDSAVDSFKKEVITEQKAIADPAIFYAIAQNLLTSAQQLGEEAGNTAKVQLLRSGTRDTTSGLQNLNTQRQALEGALSQTQRSNQSLLKTGDIDQAEADRRIKFWQNELDKNEISRWQELKNQAQANMTVLERQRAKASAGATNEAQLRAIYSSYASKTWEEAIKTNDPDVLIQWIESVDKKTAEARKGQLDAAVSSAEKNLKIFEAIDKFLGNDPAKGFSSQFRDVYNQAVAQRDAYNQAMSEATPGAGIEQVLTLRAQVSATRNRSSMQAAQVAVRSAQLAVATAKNDVDKARAEDQLAQAENALTDARQKLANARADVNADSGSQLDTATRALRDAQQEVERLSKAKDSAEYWDALRKLREAQQRLAEERSNLKFLQLTAGSDLTDPVAQAQIALQKAREKLIRDRQNKRAPDVLAQDLIDVRNAENQAEAAKFSQRLSDVQIAEQLGKISHTAYLQYLQNEHNRLSAIKNKTRQQIDELNQIDLAIKSATETMQGQWNLGQIKVPTVYEVRRAIQNSTAAASAINQAIVTNTTTNTITINGADIAKVEALLRQMLGASARYTVAPRKA